MNDLSIKFTLAQINKSLKQLSPNNFHLTTEQCAFMKYTLNKTILTDGIFFPDQMAEKKNRLTTI